MNVRDLSNLRAYCTFTSEAGTSTAPGISVDYRGRARSLGEGISEEEAEYLVDQIKGQYPNLNVFDARERFN
jgi:hypothetical protein